MGDIPSVNEEMIDQQRHADEYDRADDDRVEVSVEREAITGLIVLFVRERTQGQRAAARPGEHMARLRAVERLAGVEHERAIDHHLGQSVAEALEDAHGQRAGESDVEDLLYVRLVENGREDHQEEDGEQTDLVAAKALASAGCALLSVILMYVIPFPFRAPNEVVRPWSLDRFFLPKSTPACRKSPIL